MIIPGLGSFLENIFEPNLDVARQIAHIKLEASKLQPDSAIKQNKLNSLVQHILNAQDTAGRSLALQPVKRFITQKDAKFTDICESLMDCLKLDSIMCFDQTTLRSIATQLKYEIDDPSTLSDIKDYGASAAHALLSDSERTGKLFSSSLSEAVMLDMPYINQIHTLARERQTQTSLDKDIFDTIIQSSLYHGWNFYHLVSAENINLQCVTDDVSMAIPFAKRLLCFIFDGALVMYIHDLLTTSEFDSKSLWYAHHARVALTNARINAADFLQFNEDLREAMVHVQSLYSTKPKPIGTAEYLAKIMEKSGESLTPGNEIKELYDLIKNIKTCLCRSPLDENEKLITLVKRIVVQLDVLTQLKSVDSLDNLETL